MIKIYKANQTLTVTNGAYKEVFEPQGWKRSSGSPTKVKPKLSVPETVNETLSVEPLPTEEDIPQESLDTSEDLCEKPLSEMTFEELKDYASIMSISVGNIRNKKELRAHIRANL